MVVNKRSFFHRLPPRRATHLRTVRHPDAMSGVNRHEQVPDQELAFAGNRLWLAHELQIRVLQGALGATAQTPRAVSSHTGDCGGRSGQECWRTGLDCDCTTKRGAFGEPAKLFLRERAHAFERWCARHVIMQACA